jgi:hypothetical protein
LVLIFRRSFRGASSRRCFCCRPIGIRSADVFPLGDRRSGPPFARDIRDYRPLTGNWRLDSPPSKGLKRTQSGSLLPVLFSCEHCLDRPSDESSFISGRTEVVTCDGCESCSGRSASNLAAVRAYGMCFLLLRVHPRGRLFQRNVV